MHLSRNIFLKFLSVILLLLLLASSIVVFRTLRLSYELPNVERIRHDDIKLEDAVDRLSQGLRYQTISTQGLSFLYRSEFESFLDFVVDAYPGVHNTLERELVNNYTALYKWEGRDPDLAAAMFQGHFDVVPIEPGTEDDWVYPPFSGFVADGFIWGRGVIDDKGGIFSLLEALEYLIDQGFTPERTIYIALNHDEEIGGLNGARKVADLMLEREIEIDFLIDEGMPVVEKISDDIPHPIAMIGVAEKGYLNVELEIQKEGGHSSMPPRESTIGSLSMAIINLKENPMTGKFAGLVRETFHPIAPDLPFIYRMALSNLWLFGGVIEERLGYIPHTNAALRTTTAPTMFNAGIKENVLPQTARAVVNFRIHPRDSVQDVIEYVQNTIKDEMINVRILDGAREPSPISSSTSEPYLALEHAIHQTFEEIPVAPAMFLAATDARHFTELTHNLYRFRPIRANPHDSGRIHGTNERVSIENYEEMISFFIRLLINTTANPEYTISD